MNIEILNFVNRSRNDKAIDVAFPVLAIECEAAPPLENELDAYEEAVLRFLSLGLSTRAIARTINSTEGLIEEVLENLDSKKYAEKKQGESWKLTESGIKYLEGIVEERASENTTYGYMFVNAIKKEVLPFFYEGDINQIPLYSAEKLPGKLTLNKDENKTFEKYSPKRSTLREAFKKYFQISKISEQYSNGEITLDDAVDIFEGLDSFDEVDESDTIDAPDLQENDIELSENMFIRALKRPPKFIYLTMRIILDPSYLGGYRVESPFDLNGVDNYYYQRQIQWLVSAENVFLSSENLEVFLNREIRKLAPNFKISEKEFSVFALEKIPLLKVLKNRFGELYDNMEKIYAQTQNQQSLLEKENIVNNISRYVLESLFNRFFKSIKKETLESISKTAISDLKAYSIRDFKEMVLKNTTLAPSKIYWAKESIETVLWRLKGTNGNSIVEKFTNVIMLNYYIGTPETKTFLTATDTQNMYDLACSLNKIRCKVSHDTDAPFEVGDYDYYMKNVFTLINSLLEAHKEQ